MWSVPYLKDVKTLEMSAKKRLMMMKIMKKKRTVLAKKLCYVIQSFKFNSSFIEETGVHVCTWLALHSVYTCHDKKLMWSGTTWRTDSPHRNSRRTTASRQQTCSYFFVCNNDRLRCNNSNQSVSKIQATTCVFISYDQSDQ